jgi:hypothetical protein
MGCRLAVDSRLVDGRSLDFAGKRIWVVMIFFATFPFSFLGWMLYREISFREQKFPFA